MKVLWLLPQSVYSAPGFSAAPQKALLGSHLASMRMRTSMAVAACHIAGNVCRFVCPDLDGTMDVIDQDHVDICVLSKFFYDSDPSLWLQACKQLKANGARLLVDISDFPWASLTSESSEAYRIKRDKLVHFYDTLLPFVDAWTVGSEKLKFLISEFSDRSCTVIGDAIFASPAAPRFKPDQVLELLWFGHPSNLPDLQQYIPSLVSFSAHKPCCLNIVTSVDQGFMENISRLNRQLPDTLRLRCEPWSVERTYRSLRACDLVLLPGDPNNPRKAGVSANRIAETLQAGRLPIANTLESYLPFSDSAYLGPDLSAGIAWALAHPDDVLAKIAQVQALVSSRYGQAVVAKQWHDTLIQVASAPS